MYHPTFSLQIRVYDLTEGNGFRNLQHIDVTKLLGKLREKAKREEIDKSCKCIVYKWFSFLFSVRNLAHGWYLHDGISTNNICYGWCCVRCLLPTFGNCSCQKELCGAWYFLMTVGPSCWFFCLSCLIRMLYTVWCYYNAVQYNMIQCGAVIARSFLSKILTIGTP